jgi:MINDY deubiquitinase
MEFTQELACFDLVNVRILHGWVVDAADTELHALLSGLSYNEASFAIVSALEDRPLVRSLTRSLSGGASSGASRRCVPAYSLCAGHTL